MTQTNGTAGYNVTVRPHGLRLVLIGPPGAGKGTQAQSLIQKYRLAHISTGDMLRREVASATPLGLQARDLIAQGKLVSDQLVLAMLQTRLQQPDARAGFLLDGFPRTVIQAHALQAVLRHQGRPLTGVLCLQLSDEEVIERLSLRRTCPTCGTVYHLKACPPRHEGSCDHDRSPLMLREDDCPSVIRNRLAIYHEQTEPVIDYYRRHGLLRCIDASLSLSAVQRQMSESLAEVSELQLTR